MAPLSHFIETLNRSAKVRVNNTGKGGVTQISLPKSRKRTKPKANRPYLPGYGIATDNRGLLSWSWARKRLLKAHNYWLATVRADRLPHVVPVWGVWLDNTFCFSTGEHSRKAANLNTNPRCVVCPDGADQAVIVEGVAHKLADRTKLRKFSKAYKSKYDWDIDPSQEPIYAVEPTVVFAFKEYSLARTATCWRFS